MKKFLPLILLLAAACGSDKTAEFATSPTTTVAPTTVAPTTAVSVTTARATTTPTTTAAPTTRAAALTPGQKNAVKSAESYLKFKGFSRLGLIDQLIYEKYSQEDATFAVDNVQVNWNDEAAQSAKSYLSFKSFSRQGLIDQLVFEKFTPAEATSGVTAAGL